MAVNTPTTRPVAASSVFNGLDWAALVLVIIGGINWGLIGLFNFNLVAAIFGVDTSLSRIVYILVGLAAIWCIVMVVRMGSRGATNTRPL